MLNIIEYIVHTQFMNTNSLSPSQRNPLTVLGSQRARIPSQEAEKPSRESGKPSQSSNGPGSLAANAHGLHFFYEYENEYILDKVSI